MNQLAPYPVLPYYIDWTLGLGQNSLSEKERQWIISYSYSFYVLLYNVLQFLSIFFWYFLIYA